MGLPPFGIILEPASCMLAIAEGEKFGVLLFAERKRVGASVSELAAFYDLG
jgi:hypothetical protein